MDGVSALAGVFVFAVLILGHASVALAVWTIGFIVLVLKGTLWPIRLRTMVRLLIINHTIFGTWLVLEMQLYSSELARHPLSVVESSVSLIGCVREFLQSRIPIGYRRKTTFND
jgi:hypothetical protein